MKDANEHEIRAWLAEREPAMLALLAELVNIDSGSYDKPGVDAVGARLAQFFESAGIDVRTEPVAERGDVMRMATAPDHAGLDHAGQNFLLMGHRDTVFPKGEASRRPFRMEGGRAYGPGVADMKGGLVMNAFVMAAFRQFAPGVPLVALMTGDEEIGSLASRPFIEREARKARAVFNAEPGRVSGNVVTGRKGGLHFTFEVTGKAAHSGVNFTDGASAIGEMAHKIVALHGLTRVPEGITVNVGLAGGGQSHNTTAPHARGEIDTRYVTNDQRDHLVASVERITAEVQVPGTRSRATLLSEFLPLVPTPASEAVTGAYLAAAAELGHPISGEFTGGCADSGFTASLGAPTLCGTGPVGGKAHTADEYIEVPSLLARAQILATTVLRMARPA
jgi:glutamate carboxypeptidase